MCYQMLQLTAEVRKCMLAQCYLMYISGAIGMVTRVITGEREI
jgi:hypothetical protein